MLEQIAVLNKNSVEIVSKLSDVVGSKDSSITVNYLNNNGETSQFQLPSVGFLKKEIDLANQNIQKLSGLDSESSIIINSNSSSKKIKSVELNREPKQISNLDIVSDFTQNTNWFFENLINPLLSVKINLDDKIDESVNKVLCKRYILQFEKDLNGEYTTAGLTAKNDFADKFLYKNNTTITNFQNWLNNPTNTGVLKGDESKYVDEQTFDVNYKEINYKGFFSVLKYETDSLNNKLWYHVNSLNYYDRNGGTRKLAVGDILATTKKGSYTKWKILEVNTSSSLNRLNLERLEGYDPVPIGTNVMEYYSPLTTKNEIKVSVGFAEYNIVFLKAINTDNAIISSTWSKGMSYYTNDLTLDTDSNVSMTDFYLTTVSDYGAILKDLVAKQIPTKYGAKPNKPEIVSDNFKVVQINKHLTETKDYKTLKKLHGQKNAIKARIGQVNDAIIEKNKEINTKQYKSVPEKSKSENELKELITKQESDTKLYSSYVSQISNSNAEASAAPKFRVRGFWDIPDAVRTNGSKVQEVIGFEIQYRYGSKFGTQNITEGFEVKKNISSEQILKKTGYFSEWNKIKTDIRKRIYDEVTNDWIWEIEDISDADTPNINQLDLSIKQNEKVEIRIRSISEVGYPDAPLISDWSEIFTIEFPDSLSDVLGDSEFILKEASQEEIKVQFENELAAKGINRHVQDSYYVNEEYVAHTDKTITTSFKDEFGNTISLYDYLIKMSDKITKLEEEIHRAKGELKITLFRGTQETEIKNGANIVSVIELEDYVDYWTSTATTSAAVDIKMVNNVYMIDEFYLKIENIAKQNPLGLLTNVALTSTKATVVGLDGNFYTQYPNQFLYINDKDDIGLELYESVMTAGNIDSATGSTHVGNSTVLKDFKNFYKGTTGINDVLNGYLWESGLNAETYINSDKCALGATVYPKINVDAANNTNELVDKNKDDLHIINATESYNLPLNIYFKIDVHQQTGKNIKVNRKNNITTVKKRISISLHPENSSIKFEFKLTFDLRRNRAYSLNDTQIPLSYKN
jgi:hypothetical protein